MCSIFILDFLERGEPPNFELDLRFDLRFDLLDLIDLRFDLLDLRGALRFDLLDLRGDLDLGLIVLDLDLGAIYNLIYNLFFTNACKNV